MILTSPHLQDSANLTDVFNAYLKLSIISKSHFLLAKIDCHVGFFLWHTRIAYIGLQWQVREAVTRHCDGHKLGDVKFVVCDSYIHFADRWGSRLWGRRTHKKYVGEHSAMTRPKLSQQVRMWPMNTEGSLGRFWEPLSVITKCWRWLVIHGSWFWLH